MHSDKPPPSLRITRKQMRAGQAGREETDIKKLANFLADHRFFQGASRDEIENSVRIAFGRRDHFGVTTANGLAWLVILTHLSGRYPALERIWSKMEDPMRFNFDQIARMLQIKGQR